MIRIDDLDAFVAIVEKGGQTAAARHLRRSLQSIGRSLSALERDLKVQLVRRTTRQSRPTEAGQAFYRRIKPALADIHEARLETANRQAEPSGLLKVGAPEAFAAAFVVPAARDFMERHPRLEVELQASDQPVDFFAQGLDLAVRIRELPDSGMQARKLGELRVGVVGAPGYLARRGRPSHPNDLAGHDCILRVLDGDEASWPFRINGRRRLVRVGGRFRTNSTPAIHAATAAGLGLGFTPLWQIRALIDRGEVEVVLEEFEATRIPIHAVWPATRQPAMKVRLFTDLLASRVRRDRL
ncbi:MAG: LysR family transcriptional regulator [Proteobacteria bacterium]|nr:LysR family transcriptional regulator [Pseudomonadota bacterium]